MVMTYRPNNGVKKNNGVIGIAIVFLIISFSALYFIEINSAASLGFELRSYERDIEKLKSDNQRIKIVLTESSAMKNIGDTALAEKLNLVSLSDYQYLLISDHAGLAKR